MDQLLSGPKGGCPAVLHTSIPPEMSLVNFRWVRGEVISKSRRTGCKIYFALNMATGELMAVKEIDIPRTISDRNDPRQTAAVEYLKLESEVLKGLDHPNIVAYLGFEETPTFLSLYASQCLRPFNL